MDARIAVVIARMEETLEQGTSLAALAAAINLSVSRMSHLFRAEVGVSPGRYLHAIRMQRSRILLERTFLSVKEVMARVGVRDPSHFARDFRRHHGITPSQVRRGTGQTSLSPRLLMPHLNGAAPASAAAAAAPAAATEAAKPPLGGEPDAAAHAVSDHDIERQDEPVDDS